MAPKKKPTKRAPPRRSAENSKGSAKAKGKPRGRPWPPGVSGNPGGRPKSVKEVQELASTFTEEAVKALVFAMRLAQVPGFLDLGEVRQAATALLNRACGMPTQPISGGEFKPLESEFPTLLAALKKLNDPRGEPAPPAAAAAPAAPVPTAPADGQQGT